MEMLTIDYQEEKEFPTGNYEVVITSAEVTKFRNSIGIVLKLVIRTDVDQPMQGEVLKDVLYWTKSASYKPNQVAKAVGIPKGVTLDINELADIILFCPVKVYVSMKANGYGEVEPHVSSYSVGKEIDETTLKRQYILPKEWEFKSSEIEEKNNHQSECIMVNGNSTRQLIIDQCKVKYIELSKLYDSHEWEWITAEIA